jgi:hypothetical protein
LWLNTVKISVNEQESFGCAGALFIRGSS